MRTAPAMARAVGTGDAVEGLGGEDLAIVSAASLDGPPDRSRALPEAEPAV